MSLIGNNSNQISLNSMLGEMAFQDRSSAIVGYVYRSVQTFYISTTWTKPDFCRAIRVVAIGAGGGGGGAAGIATGQNAGGGGGGGAYDETFIENPASSYLVTIGSGGIAGTSAGGNGGAGGVTKVHVDGVTNLVVAGGGLGGAGRTAGSATAVRAGLGGIGGGLSSDFPIGIIGLEGNAGHSGGMFANTGTPYGGKGGTSPLMGGDTFFSLTNTTPAAPTTRGAGGSGACCSNNATGRAGAAGANGLVIIYEYY